MPPPKAILVCIPQNYSYAQPFTPHAALVHYALGQGQPVNSVLEGLLPLHAAASNGSEPVVYRKHKSQALMLGLAPVRPLELS